MIFSFIFDTSGKSEIDQQFLGSFFAPFLNKGFNLAILHSSGKDDNLINLLCLSKEEPILLHHPLEILPESGPFQQRQWYQG